MHGEADTSHAAQVVRGSLAYTAGLKLTAARLLSPPVDECALAGQSSTLSARARGVGAIARSIAPSLCAALLATRE